MEKKRPTRNRGFKGIEVLKAITSVKNVPQRTCFISLHYSVIVIHLKIKDGFSSACQLKDSKETPLPFKSSDCEDHRSIFSELPGDLIEKYFDIQQVVLQVSPGSFGTL